MTDQADLNLAVDPAPIEETMSLFEKGARATTLYLPNNPMYELAVTRMQDGFRRLWEEETELNLRVTAECFQWMGHDILPGREKADSLAWVLYGDGVRAVTLLPGVEDKEIFRLLAVIQQTRMIRAGAAGAASSEETEADDDLQTLLWTEDFEFIHYHVIEIGDEDYPSLQPSTDLGGFAAPETASTAVREDAAQPEADPFETGHQMARADDFNPTLYFLEPKEIAYLKSEFDREYDLNLHDKVLRILFDLFEEGKTYGNARQEILGVLDTFMPFLLASGDFGAVAYILSEARTLAKTIEGLHEVESARLLDYPARLSKPEALGQLFQMLMESHAAPTRDELSELFSQLRSEATTTVLTWIPRFPDGDVRHALEAAVEPMARANPEQLRGAFSSPSSETVIGALRLVYRLGTHTLANDLLPLTDHADVAVRLELVEVLAKVAAPTMIKQLVGLLDDEDRDVRISVAQKLAERKYYLAADKFEKIIADRIRHAELREKRVFFEVYGILGREKSVGQLSQILIGKGVFRRKDDAETRACAAMALGKVGEAARSALEAAKKEKDPVIRNAVGAALREIGIE